VRVADVVDGVLLVAVELAAVVENAFRSRLECDVQPELLVPALAGVLARDALNRFDQIERRGRGDRVLAWPGCSNITRGERGEYGAPRGGEASAPFKNPNAAPTKFLSAILVAMPGPCH